MEETYYEKEKIDKIPHRCTLILQNRNKIYVT